MSWDPGQYLNFSDERKRPAHDLIAQIPDTSYRQIVDLGCGPGTVTALLKQRWPDAAITGVDRSRAMLSRAEQSKQDIAWIQGDIADWQPDTPVDLLFSNACLHWQPDHDRLFPRLVRWLAPGGILAVQMPRNFDRSMHTAAEIAAHATGTIGQLSPLLRQVRTDPPARYVDRLSGCVAELNVWETDYLHILHGDDPVAEWTKGSFLRPLLDRLNAPERRAFETCYRAILRERYPKRADGTTCMPFRRLFILARR